mmetsp:Transcript_25356/g.28122  ORF Transcript_25356/g.28122 Transcript_25356/m.28122 type:complete len:178 (-) Transcript_25356:105-638(-)
MNGIPNIYMKYKEEARDVANSMKKKNLIRIKEKYSNRVKEVEVMEKKKSLLMHKRVANGASHNVSYDAPRDDERSNYHYNLPHSGNHLNSRSEDYRDVAKPNGAKYNGRMGIIKLPATTKGLDNLSVDDNETRKARILRHAQEIREAVSLNKERASGSSGIYKASGMYAPTIPKWWG